MRYLTPFTWALLIVGMTIGSAAYQVNINGSAILTVVTELVTNVT